VLVYVPSAALAPIPSQLTCDRCGAMPSGSPVAIALSDATGHFKLDGVPAGANVPIVVQTGKWRRLQFVPTVAPCADNPLTDPNLTRLPRSATEGSLPRIAIATSALDPFECVLKKFGIDGNEFSAPGGAGHVQLFAENGASMGGPLPDAGSQATLLYGDPATLQSFDQVLFGCEGQLGTKDPTYAQNLADYLALGGRAWFEHYELAWLQAMPAAYASMITFAPDQTVPTMTLTVETAFPKGSALATWMQKVGVIGGGPPTFSAPDTRGDITSAVGQSWLSASASVTGADGGVVDVGVSEQVSFNTPPSLPASQQCGRVVFSDYHSGDTSTQGPSFPAECDTSSLTPESKALEFMLFDLGGCILPDGVVPSPP
jgi:hypothetical protein